MALNTVSIPRKADLIISSSSSKAGAKVRRTPLSPEDEIGSLHANLSLMRDPINDSLAILSKSSELNQLSPKFLTPL